MSRRGRIGETGKGSLSLKKEALSRWRGARHMASAVAVPQNTDFSSEEGDTFDSIFTGGDGCNHSPRLLQEIAARRRLTPDEVVEIIVNYGRYGLTLADAAGSDKPSSGTLVLCHRDHVTRVKNDGIVWMKRSGTNKVREDQSKARSAAGVSIRVCFTRSVVPPEIARRRYTLEAPPPAGKLCLLHYFVETTKSATDYRRLLAAGSAAAAASGDPILALVPIPPSVAAVAKAAARA
ncbi:unnamed protein product, partial [Phaeothamnion confervicola]